MIPLYIRIVVAGVVLWAVQVRPGGLAPVGNLLDPLDGLYANARNAEHPAFDDLVLPGLERQVFIERDLRGVPHIFAESDRDLYMALGFTVAQDRLFQMDFLAKLAAGRLSEIFGPASIETDRYLRGTGMAWAARRIAARIEQDGGMESDLISWFGAGANAVIDNLSYRDLPFEFKLFGYTPDRYGAMHAALLIQYFNFDLSFETDEAAYGELLARLGQTEYERLYPRHSTLYRPIIPESYSYSARMQDAATPQAWAPARNVLRSMAEGLKAGNVEGFRPGKGSNNWAVTGTRSETGRPILAGDMHLSLSLPSIWYEAHLVTDSSNIYGVLAPGTPVPVQAITDHVAWTYTNSGLDGIDHYLLQLDDDRQKYLFDGQWRPVTHIPDTIQVRGSRPVIDTLLLSHLGPIVWDSSAAISLRWVAHDHNTTLKALWGMQQSQHAEDIDAALEHWHSPAQNVLYADIHGTIGLRVAGVLPVRGGGNGVGLLDGTTSAAEWTGYVDFEAMPHAIAPSGDYLTSTNQQPTTPDYPHYVGHDWSSAYRSLRIDSLLSAKDSHSFDDFRRYQSDIKVVQHALFAPLVATTGSLSADAAIVRDVLVEWDGQATEDNLGALVLYEFLLSLKMLAWDEEAFAGMPTPSEVILYQLLQDDSSVWLDIQATPMREQADGLLRAALEETALVMRAKYGIDPAGWRWGDHHRVIIKHLTQTPALSALWSGPIPYPGFDETLAPGDELEVTHSASWRVIVDFADNPPTAQGMYAGGQSGNPFSRFYDLHIADYVSFRYNDLHKPRGPGELDSLSSMSTLTPE